LPQGCNACSGMAAKHFAVGGEINAASTSLEQDDAKCFLEFGNGLRNGGLGRVECLGGADEASPFGHFEEAAHLSVLDPSSDGLNCFHIHIDIYAWKIGIFNLLMDMRFLSWERTRKLPDVRRPL